MRAAGAPGQVYWEEPWLRAACGERVERGWAARRLCAAHLDSAARFLAVCGWNDLATRARGVRDEVVDGRDVADEVRAVVRRAERSWALRRLVAGLGPLPAARACAAGVGGPALEADGDAYDRFRVWLERIGRAAADFTDGRLLGADEPEGPRGRLDGPVPPSRALLDVLPALLEGAEFAGARALLASLGPDLDELALTVPPEVGHG
ncbi:hypothetical protein [Streptomyces malaysiensis]|uniref:hypothetical protein n=1 Tax=Streptomyces malaysiensis TaxID=92644 RepID=UPI0020C5F677|nr:hypothetical protein [Streptomyces samsunensis]